MLPKDSSPINLPDWLLAKPAATGIAAASVTREQQLPIDSLSWENFERLCLHLARKDSAVTNCRIYGEQGNNQQGIDLYGIPFSSNRYRVYQCKRVKRFNPSDITLAITKFIKGEWSKRTETFVLCTTLNLRSPAQADSIEKQRKRLKKLNINLAIWDKHELEIQLKQHADIVEDFFGPIWRASFCGINDSQDSSKPAQTEKYRRWLLGAINTITIPGIGRTLKLDTAWLPLRARDIEETSDLTTPQRNIEDWIARYHEWERLREGELRQGYDADKLHLAGSHIIVVGGPGSGKSTLLRRLSCLLTQKGQLVAWVRLPRVLAHQAAGQTFESAVHLSATDGSALSRADSEKLLASPDVLIADGLDECEPSRHNIIEDLHRWMTGHPQTRVIISTRPVGHPSERFQGWRHVELQPLDRDSIQANVQHLLGLHSSPEHPQASPTQITQKLTENATLSLASRNPLLLGFLVQILSSNSFTGDRRTDLFDAIFQLVLREPTNERNDAPALDKPTALSILEHLGWHSRKHPTQTLSTLISQTADTISPSFNWPPGTAKQMVERGIRFWESRRILERWQGEFQEAVTFVHALLEEFAAARYLSRLQSSAIATHIQSLRRDPRWREVIRLAAECGAHAAILQALLTLDDPADPTSSEAMLAALILEDTRGPPDHIADTVFLHLYRRLESTLPSVAFDAVRACVPLAKNFPQLIDSRYQMLLGSSQPWSQLAGVRLLLASSSGSIQPEFLANLIAEIVLLNGDKEPTRRALWHWKPGRDVEREVIIEGLAYLSRVPLTDQVAQMVRRIIEKGELGGRTRGALLSRLSGTHFEPTVRAQQDTWEHFFGNIFNPRDFEDADRAFLEAVGAIATPPRINHKYNEPPDCTSLALVYQSMHWGDMDVSDWKILERQIDTEALQTVLRGTIEALELNLEELGHETTWLINNFETLYATDEHWRGFGLTTWLPSVPTPSPWNQVKQRSLEIEPLVRALVHPSGGVAFAAAQLLTHGAGRGDPLPYLENYLRDATEKSMLYVAHTIPTILQTRAPDFLLHTLSRNVTRPISTLYETLVRVHSRELPPRAIACLLNGLDSQDAGVVENAADALLLLNDPLPQDITLHRIRVAFNYWLNQASWCTKDQLSVPDIACPVCKIVQPHPRLSLWRILVRLGGADADLCLAIATNPAHRMGDSAIQELLRAPTRAHLALIVDLLQDGRLSLSALDTLLYASPRHLLVIKRELLSLLNSPNLSIRLRMWQAMDDSKWLTVEEINSAARQALNDPAPDVRDEVVRVLRALDANPSNKKQPRDARSRLRLRLGMKD